jgi:hypothetical protein
MNADSALAQARNHPKAGGAVHNEWAHNDGFDRARNRALTGDMCEWTQRWHGGSAETV